MNRPATAAKAVSVASARNADLRQAAQTIASETPPEWPAVSSTGRSLSIERGLMRKLLTRLHEPPIRIVLWDGSVVQTHHPAPTHTLHVHNRRAVWQMAWDPQFGFGEGYASGSLTVDGEFCDFLRIAVASSAPTAPAARHRPRWPQRNKSTLHLSKENIHRHYDIGNDFYKLWLDDRMLYTCAYYADPQMTLEQAQAAKMDHICRKLRLQPGETVIEAGCGWGGFALHMAREYGVTVRAYNISREQIRYARETARRENLDDRVEFIEDDWRNCSGDCDVFVSVGMLEHVGLDNYRELGEVVSRCLDRAGRGLIHSIGRNFPHRLNSWIERRIFPGAQPPSLGQAMEIFEGKNLSILDVENIRLHYALTCRDWLQRFEDRLSDVCEMFDERFVRMWRLYLATSMVAFECGTLQLFQMLFAPGRSNNIPWTRAYQYVDAPQPESGAVWNELSRERTDS